MADTGNDEHPAPTEDDAKRKVTPIGLACVLLPFVVAVAFIGYWFVSSLSARELVEAGLIVVGNLAMFGPIVFALGALFWLTLRLLTSNRR
jgi:hypothetical protein